MIRALPHPECPGGPRVHPHSSQECAEGPKAHLLRDVIVAGVNAVPEQVLGAAVTAAEVTVVHELPVGAEGTCLPSLPESGAPTQAMGRVSIWYWGCQEGGHRRNAPPDLPTQMTVYSKDGGQGIPQAQVLCGREGTNSHGLDYGPQGTREKPLKLKQ